MHRSLSREVARSDNSDSTQDPAQDPTEDPTDVPLPIELPKPPDLSTLPSHILHSGTVETLIGQNEDLFARLKVNIRRNGLLEQQIMEQERINSELTHVNHSLMAQLQVHQEKDRSWKERTLRVGALEKQVKISEESRRRLTAYRNRVQKWVKPLIRNLRASLAKERDRAKTLEASLTKREAVISELRARLSESVLHVQSLEKNLAKDHSRLVEQYETKQKNLTAELEKARGAMKIMEDKAALVDDSVNRYSALQNHVVYLERRNEELERALRHETQDYQAQIARYRAEAKLKEAEALDSQRRQTEDAAALAELRQDYDHLRDRFENLQTLWNDLQKRFETAMTQKESLRRLNQELTREADEHRNARTAPPKANSSAPAAALPIEQKISRIETLLTEIESGFKMSPLPEANQAHDLEIIEPQRESKTEEPTASQQDTP